MNEMKFTFKIPGSWDDPGSKYEIVIDLASGKAKVDGVDYDGLRYTKHGVQLGELEINMDAEWVNRMKTREGGFERSIFFDILW